MTPRIVALSILALALSPAGLAAQVSADVHTELTPRVIGADEGERRNLPDGRHMLLKVGPENTGSSYLFLGSEVLPPGASIPRHRHEVDEEILIVHRGAVTVELDGTVHHAEEGAVVYLPPRTWVSVRNEGDDSAAVMFVFPRGSVERCFQFIGRGDDGERARPADPGEESRSCQMTYRPG
jgi:quercetin dioxygenase-like cupin family protein